MTYRQPPNPRGGGSGGNSNVMINNQYTQRVTSEKVTAKGLKMYMQLLGVVGFELTNNLTYSGGVNGPTLD